METTRSDDGTTIAFERIGQGEPLLILGGAFNTRMMAAGLAHLLSHSFTVFTIDRRGRGDSGMTEPYATEREIEDVAAVLEEAGGEALLYGHSAGAVLALEAAAAGLPITRLAVYEPPFGTDFRALAAVIQREVDAGNPGAGALAFMNELEPGSTDGIEQQPWWPSIVSVAHTLTHEMALLADGRVPTSRLAQISSPTLVISGSDSPDWGRGAMPEVVTAIPGARLHVIDGQSHEPSDDAVAPVLAEFFL